MKTYYIGLGGSGLKTVSDIQKRISTIPDWENDYEFTYIDTDVNTYRSINRDRIVINAPDFIDIGDTNPKAVHAIIKNKPNKNADEKRFMEWVIPQEPGHMVLPNHPLTDGAAASRNLGRIALYSHYYTIKHELERKLYNFTNSPIDPYTSQRDVDIWVVASACGGTGSAILLDILYMINSIANPIVSGIGEPNLKLVLFMPQAYVDKNKGNYNHPLNAYSCLWEINAFRNAFENGNGKTFEMFAARPTEMTKPILDFPLYKFAVPVDVETDRDTKLNLDTNFYPTIAEMIYNLSYGTGANELCCNLSNDIYYMRGEDGKTKSLIGYGFRAIRKPNKELKDYLETRGVYEILKYGFLDKSNLGKVKDEAVHFAQNCILSKLTDIMNSRIGNESLSYEVDGYRLDNDSLHKRITNLVNSIIKYDPNELSSKHDTEILEIQIKYTSIYYHPELANIRNIVFESITKAIDRGIDETIINYGLEFAYELLAHVDDFYLEPLYRHIKDTLIPDLNAQLEKQQYNCVQYVRKGLQRIIKRKHFEEASKALEDYKDTLINQIVLTMASEIIYDLTTAPDGYLEVIRKGDKFNHAGLIKLKAQVSALCVEYETEYSELAKSFRATESDATTLFLPSLADIAKSPNNFDWKPDNFFDTLYQGSILEQEELDKGLEKVLVPKRSDVSGHCLSNYLTMLDPDINLFSNIIKDKDSKLATNVEKDIRIKLVDIIKRQACDPQTTAGQFLICELKDIPHYYPEALPTAIYNNFDAFFNDFQPIEKIPVFFPLRAGLTTPTAKRIVYVGNDINFAHKIGYNDYDCLHQWIYDQTMTDQIMVMRFDVGLSFDMYKYFSEYKRAYEALKARVKNKYHGCHIHKIFNECNDFQEILNKMCPEKKDFTESEDRLSTNEPESVVNSEGIEGISDIMGENNTKDK